MARSNYYVSPALASVHSSKCGCGSCTMANGLRGIDGGLGNGWDDFVKGVQTFGTDVVNLITGGAKAAGIDLSALTNVAFGADELNAIAALATGSTFTGQQLIDAYKNNVLTVQLPGAVPGLTAVITKNPASAAAAMANSVAAGKNAAKNVIAAQAAASPAVNTALSFATSHETQLLIAGGVALAAIGLIVAKKKKLF